jgi:hypothetical protein
LTSWTINNLFLIVLLSRPYTTITMYENKLWKCKLQPSVFACLSVLKTCPYNSQSAPKSPLPQTPFQSILKTCTPPIFHPLLHHVLSLHTEYRSYNTFKPSLITIVDHDLLLTIIILFYFWTYHIKTLLR